MIAITPDMVVAAYEFLRVLPPFRSWSLPHSDDIIFRTHRDKSCHGFFTVDKNGTRILAVNDASVGHTLTLLQITGHEIIHLRQHLRGEATSAAHNSGFRRLARQVCKCQGWDVRMFFM